jgi:hypothetical protein
MRQALQGCLVIATPQKYCESMVVQPSNLGGYLFVVFALFSNFVAVCCLVVTSRHSNSTPNRAHNANIYKVKAAYVISGLVFQM